MVVIAVFFGLNEARCDITDYIVGFYNTQRMHSALGYLSPLAYEQENA